MLKNIKTKLQKSGRTKQTNVLFAHFGENIGCEPIKMADRDAQNIAFNAASQKHCEQ